MSKNSIEDKVWIVNFGHTRKTYRSEKTFLKALAARRSDKDVIVECYKLDSTYQNMSAKEVFEQITQVEKRNKKIEAILAGEDVEKEWSYELIKMVEKYVSGNIFLNKLRSIAHDEVAFRNYVKSKRRMFMDHISNDLEYYKVLLKVIVFKKEGNENYNLAKQEMGL